MIGVVCKPGERTVVSEFFELFKTPWELYQPGHTYDAVLSSADEIPDSDARLVIIYGSNVKSYDHRANLVLSGQERGARLRYRGGEVPLYGENLRFDQIERRAVCLTTESAAVGVEVSPAEPRVLRLGYDFFQEIGRLLSVGQPTENACAPTLELHIQMLRDWLLESGIAVLEIPPSPAGRDFLVCLTHDIDFAGLRRHKLDHTMWGFLYRATLGACRDFLQGRISAARLCRDWHAAFCLPFVYLGWVRDYWMQFDWYLQVEQGLPATYFLIPFKGRAGERLHIPHPQRRATKYDVGDIPEWTAAWRRAGGEVGVHGIDAWHDVEKGRAELERVRKATGEGRVGIRMHWLACDENTFGVLDQAGYAYDSTSGYNDAVGYRCGTTQAFRPLTATRLLELPLHIQDGALFYRRRLNLTEDQAWQTCEACLENARRHGGVLTVLWHDRSPGPERFWGDFYQRLIERLRALNVWFASAGQAVDWFAKRRAVRFERATREAVTLAYSGERIDPALTVRVHRQGRPPEDHIWHGETPINVTVKALSSRCYKGKTAPALAV